MKIHLELCMFENYDRILISKETTEITLGDTMIGITSGSILSWWRSRHKGKNDVFFWLVERYEISGCTKAGYNTDYNHTTTYNPADVRSNLRKTIRKLRWK